MKPRNATKVVEIHGVTSDDGKHNFVIRKHSDGTISSTEFKRSIGPSGLGHRWMVVRDARAGEVKRSCTYCNCCNCN